MYFFQIFLTLLNLSKCKALGDFLISLLETVISEDCLGGTLPKFNSLKLIWDSPIIIFWHWLLTSDCNPNLTNNPNTNPNLKLIKGGLYATTQQDFVQFTKIEHKSNYMHCWISVRFGTDGCLSKQLVCYRINRKFNKTQDCRFFGTIMNMNKP